MKDLKRYITKPKKHKKSIDEEIDENNCSSYEALAFCISNSFEEVKNLTDQFVSFGANEFELYLSFNENDMIHLEDYDIPSDFIRINVLNALLPDYSYDEFYDYSYPDNNEEELNEIMERVEEFHRNNKIPKEYDEWVKDYMDSECGIFCYVIKSRYLIKIYNNEKLRDLFTDAIYGEFIRPNLYYYANIYCDGGQDESHCNPSALIKFIKAYKKIFPRKRMNKKNYSFARNLKEISDELGEETNHLIHDVLSNFSTDTEVMF